MTETGGVAAAGARAGTDYPTACYAWYVVVILTLTFILSLIDRNVMGLVIAPIKAEMGLNDLEVGLLLGAAFALFYVTLGLPMGFLADTVNRRLLIAAGIVLWSLMTVACGLADGFGTLFAARLGVGFGEAALVPSALSLIGDYFPKDRRARAVSLFMTGALLGTGVAFLLGGPLAGYLERRGGVQLPLVGFTKPWQLMFIIVGTPGLLIAALMLLTIREPPRREKIDASVVQGNKQSVFAAFAYLRAERSTYLPLFFGMACVLLLGYTALWTAPVFERTWGWSIAAIGVANGALIFVAAIPGTTSTGLIADRLRARGALDGPLRAAIIGATVLLPGYVLYPLMPNGELALAWLYVALFGQSMASAAGPASILNVAPGQFRGQIVALYLLVTNVTGLLLGPGLVGWLTDMLGGPSYLHYSLSAVACAVGVLAIVLLVSGRKAYIETASRS